jgi:hypothetical protein
MDSTCARCKKQIRQWMGSPETSHYGKAIVCDVCYIQEYMEVNGRGPKNELAHKPRPYDGPPYWDEKE